MKLAMRSPPEIETGRYMVTIILPAGFKFGLWELHTSAEVVWVMKTAITAVWRCNGIFGELLD